jgi:pilus assembly protein TadC
MTRASKPHGPSPLLKGITDIVLRASPSLKKKLHIAHLRDTPESFIRRSVKAGLLLALALAAAAFFFLGGKEPVRGILYALLVFAATALIGSVFFFRAVDVAISKRRRLMEQEALFAGRYLLVKLQSGAPLFGSLIEMSRSFGLAGRFFKEIVDDVNTGTPLEDALANAATLSPSRNFKIILWQIHNALRSGADVSDPLRYILKEITDQQIIEIERYGKKLNSLTLFYMLVAIIVPSLGTSFLTIIAGFVGLSVELGHLMGVLILLVFLQFMFLAGFRSIRPLVQV